MPRYAKVVRKTLEGKVQIDEKQLEMLCRLHCTMEEIANFFNVSLKAIENFVRKKYNMNFKDYYAWKSAQGKVSLRQAQFKQALEGNTQMLIYLGRVLLGQQVLTEPVKIVFELVDTTTKDKAEDEKGGGESDQTISFEFE